jgi:anti-anti-sigma factor
MATAANPPAQENAVRLITVAVNGELDRTTAPQVSDTLDDALAMRPGHLTLDLAECSFIDAGGINLLLDVQRRMREAGGLFTLQAAPPRLRWVFALTRVDHLLHLASPSTSPTRKGDQS